MNIIDLVLVVLIFSGLFKSLGNPWKIVRGLLVTALLLMVFGVFARLAIDLPLPDQAKAAIKESYFIQLSTVMIKWSYPAVEDNAPKVGSFIKEKIIAEPTPEVTLPPVTLPDKLETEKLLQRLDKAVRQK